MFRRVVVNGLPVKADDIDVLRPQSRRIHQFFGNIGVKQSQTAFNVFDFFGVGLRAFARNRTQVRAHFHVIRTV